MVFLVVTSFRMSGTPSNVLAVRSGHPKATNYRRLRYSNHPILVSTHKDNCVFYSTSFRVRCAFDVSSILCVIRFRSNLFISGLGSFSLSYAVLKPQRKVSHGQSFYNLQQLLLSVVSPCT